MYYILISKYIGVILACYTLDQHISLDIYSRWIIVMVFNGFICPSFYSFPVIFSNWFYDLDVIKASLFTASKLNNIYNLANLFFHNDFLISAFPVSVVCGHSDLFLDQLFWMIT